MVIMNGNNDGNADGDNGKIRKYQALVKKVKDIDIGEYLCSRNTSDMKIYMIQLLNIYLKNSLKALNITELGKTGKFF